MSVLNRWGRPAALVALLAFGTVFPLIYTAPLTTNYAIVTLLFVGGVAAWNMFSGYSGYISLGHGVFFGCSAYTVALIAFHQNLKGGASFALLPVGGLVAAAVALPFGLIALRVRRHTFVVVTIAVFFIFQLMAYNLPFTRGSVGVATPFAVWNPATYNNPYYYAAFIVAVGAIALSWLVRGSRFGLQLLAIRDDEDRARGLGVRTMRVKVTAFVLSAFVAGVVGGLSTLFVGSVVPQGGFDPAFDLSIALMAFLGGFGTLWGPVLGALILEPLQQELTQRFTNGYTSLIVLGCLFLLVILFLPRGLIPTGKEWIDKLRAWSERRGQSASAAAGAVAVPADGAVGAAASAKGSDVSGAGGAR